MILSVICPTFNEINYINKLFESFQDSENIDKEIYFVDGGSTDGTLEQIEALKRKYSFIHVVDNPMRYVSHGFNEAFKKSKGKYIAFLGAHAVYPSGYFSRAIDYLSSNECDVVGGPLKQEGKTATGKAIAWCMSTRFGVGDTEFRTSNKKRIVQSVAFAVYKREIFEKVGLLDEQLVRNQDDEFHYRINKFGYRIMMVPEMQCTYFVRESLVKLARQYFQYGLYKPLVFKKVKSGFRVRHFVPSMFVLYLVIAPLTLFYPVIIIPAILYFAMDIFFSFKNKNSGTIKIIALLVYPVLHLSYGVGFLLGLVKVND